MSPHSISVADAIERHRTALGRTIPLRLAETSHTMKSASLAADLGETAVRDTINGGRRNNPTLETLSSIGHVLDCTVGFLIGETSDTKIGAGISQLRDEIETAFDLLTALDKTGDGIGGDVGHGVSAVALAARAALDNARSMLKAMEAGR